MFLKPSMPLDHERPRRSILGECKEGAVDAAALLQLFLGHSQLMWWRTAALTPLDVEARACRLAASGRNVYTVLTKTGNSSKEDILMKIFNYETCCKRIPFLLCDEPHCKDEPLSIHINLWKLLTSFVSCLCLTLLEVNSSWLTSYLRGNSQGRKEKKPRERRCDKLMPASALHQTAPLQARALTPKASDITSNTARRHKRRTRGPLHALQDDSASEPVPWRPKSFLSPATPNQTLPLPEIHELGPFNDEKLKDWSTCTASQFYEYDYFIESSLVEGHWPAELHGTYICNSPALPSIFGHHVRNLADADGMVTSIAIGEDGRVFFRNRFVRTPSFASEQLAGRRLHRGFHDRGLLSGDGSPLHSWLLNPLDMRFPSRANAGVLNWGGRLYALSERDLPFELSKQVLDTLGTSSLPGNVLRGNARELSGRYKVLADDGNGQRLVLMSTTQSMMDVLTLCATMTFIELDEAGRKLAEVQHRIPGALAVSLTEFSVTDNWYVLVAPPISFNGQRFATSYMLGDVSFSECLDFDAAKPSKIHLIPRGQSKEATQQQVTKAPIHEEMRKPGPSLKGKGINRHLEASRPLSHSHTSDNHLQQSRKIQAARQEAVVLDGPPLMTGSIINSYECDGGRLVVLDAICERDLGFWKDVSNPVVGYYGAGAKPEITRFTIDVQHPRLLSTRVLSHRSAQHAAVASTSVGHPHQFIFSAASAVESATAGSPPQAISKLFVPSAEQVASSAGGQPQRQSCSPCEVWYTGDRCFSGPPMLLPKASNGTAGSEDHAWLLCLVHDAETAKAELVVLDASKLTAGPVARICLPHHVPYASAVTWSKEILGPGRVLENLRIRGQLKR